MSRYDPFRNQRRAGRLAWVLFAVALVLGVVAVWTQDGRWAGTALLVFVAACAAAGASGS